MVLSRIAASPDEGRTVAPRAHGAIGLLSGKPGCRAVWPAETTESICCIMGRTSRWLGRFPHFFGGGPVFYSWIPLGQTTHPVAAAQPSDRDLCLHRSDPGRAVIRDGDYHALWACRTVRRIRSDFRNQFSTAE